MTNPTYPKTYNIWKRDDETKKLIPNVFEKEEFGSIKNWHFTEKIDGTNVRIINNGADMAYLGRESSSGLPKALKKYLINLFEDSITPFGSKKEKLKKMFPSGLVVLYGEGYGGKIRNGGRYSKTPKFILFQIEYRAYDPVKNKLTSWWLSRENVEDISIKLKIDVVPLLTLHTIEEAITMVKKGFKSLIAEDRNLMAEGIVASSNPIMHFRDGDPIRFKIKHKDMMRLDL